MEIKLNAGDKINIPENCKATIEDNLIIIEEKQEEKKDGDCSYYNSEDRLPLKWIVWYFCHATEEEKQALFDDLKANGLKWNDETKTMEKIRQRVEKGREYLIVNRLGDVVKLVDEHSTFDDMNYHSGNYYLLSESEQAEEDAKAVKAIFEKRLKVIESEFPHFRKGYVLASKTSDLILIFNRFKDKEKQFFVSAYNNTHEEGSRIYESDMFRRATSEETRRLYKQMKEEGLYWNFITKCVESIDTRTAYNSLWYETDPLWHKISDGDLPNKSGMFLVSIKGGHHQVIRYCHKDKLWATVFEQEDLEYWRENPSLPGK